MIKRIVVLFGLLFSTVCFSQTFPVNNINIQGQLQLGGSPGTAGQIPQSNGTSPPSWVSGIISGAVNPSLNYLSSLTGAVSRSYQSKFGDWNSVKDFGAVGNGVTSDGAAILAADTAGPVIVPAGTYVISSSITLPNAVQFLPGAVFAPNSGVTVTFSGPVIAGVQQIFTGGGESLVVINSQYTSTGYPEWWGGVTGNPSVDQSTFINYCLIAVTVCQGQAGTYYTTGTIKQQVNLRAFVGAAPDIPGTSGATLISNNSNSNTIWQIGPNTYTGSLQNTAMLKNVYILRSVAPVISSAPVGLLVQYTVWASVSNVQLQDSTYGVEIVGIADSFFDKVFSGRTLAGSGGGTDLFYGFWLNASTNIGGAGGSESVYITNSGASSTVPWTSALNYQGFVATGTYGYSDTFLVNFTTSNTGFGITFVGNGNSGTTADVQNEDVQIINPILDTCQIACLNFNSTSLYGSIQVVGGYAALGTIGSTPTGILYTSSLGAVSVSSLQILCTEASGGKAVSASSSRAITQIGNKYLECSGVPLTLNNVIHSRFEDQILAYSKGSTNQPAVEIFGSSTRLVFKMSVDGASNAYSQGYYMPDTTTSFSEFNASGLNAGSISADKINNAGTAVTAVGIFNTTNYATGVMN